MAGGQHLAEEEGGLGGDELGALAPTLTLTLALTLTLTLTLAPTLALT
jgi:hypothetical protein